MTFDKELPSHLKHSDGTYCTDPDCDWVSEFIKTEGDVEINITETMNLFRNNESVSAALEIIRRRSFSGRHPELGKMVKCQICKTRHRENERKCEQKFATGRYDLRNPKPLLIAGQTPETAPDRTIEADIERKTMRIALGAPRSINFSSNRKKQHLNRRKSQFVNVVHLMIEDGYTQKELEHARKLAKHILVLRWGRYHFLESQAEKSQRLKKQERA